MVIQIFLQGNSGEISKSTVFKIQIKKSQSTIHHQPHIVHLSTFIRNILIYPLNITYEVECANSNFLHYSASNFKEICSFLIKI